MTRWFRFYDDALNDPKILKLSDKSYRIWTQLLCAASKNDGRLPLFEDLAIMLRMKPEKLQPELEKLITAGLIDHDDIGMRPHNWNARQFKSDVSTERVKRFRNAQHTVSETPPDTDTDTDTEAEKKEDSSLRSLPPKSKKIPLPDDWQVSETGHAYAVSRGMPSSKVPLEAERFKNHSQSKGRLFAGQRGIEAAWRNWATSPFQTAGPQKSIKETKQQRWDDAYQDLKHAADRIREGGEGNGTVIGILPPIASQ